MNRVVTVPACFVALIFAPQKWARADERPYPRSELLVEAKDLADPKIGAKFVILDVRPRMKYLLEHVPNATWLDNEDWARAFGHGDRPRDWSQRIGELGVDAKTKVVVYDDMRNRDAARVWWILRYWGVDDVRLLDGGWKAWKDGQFATDSRDVGVHPVEFVAKPRGTRLATKEQLLRSLRDGSVGGKTLQIVDARSEREFCGLERMRNKRAGAIPGAKQLEWIDLIDNRTHRFKSAAELRQIFASAGIALDRPTATHCQSGGRSSVMAFGLELMGVKDVSNYYPSWAEWSSAEDTPVVAGKPRPKN
jgi:thiosulfate/3-mercaptopyruvate sulfurtransferase